ncbi:MAG: DinB family protein [Planctomycetota bacterium]|nr:DinB family protein [Planctomycetota bacterium]
MSHVDLIEQYAAGPKLIAQAVSGMSDDDLNATPIIGKWSTRQVVCHLADFEPVYADRMKRVIAEDRPTFFGGDPNEFAARLAYEQRDVAEELRLIEVVRAQMTRILRTLAVEDFQRSGVHSEDGPMTLETLIQRITKHVPHHVAFIDEKRNAIKADS